jgi:hypothetical protein
VSISARTPGTVASPGRRMIRVSRLKQTPTIKPSVLPLDRLGDAGASGTAADCVIMLRPADKEAAPCGFRLLNASGVAQQIDR